VEEHCGAMFEWVVERLGARMYKLPMLVKKLLHFQKEEYLFESQDKSQNQGQIDHVSACFARLSHTLALSYFRIQGTTLDLGIRLPKKARRDWSMEEEPDLKSEVTKLANVCTMVSEFMLEYIASGMVARRINLIPENYVTSLISFASLYFTKFAAETHYPEEANALINSSLWLLENYLAYKSVLLEERHKKKKEKRQLYKQQKRNSTLTNKQTLKKDKLRHKNLALPDHTAKDSKSKDNNESNIVSDLKRSRTRKNKPHKRKELASKVTVQSQ
jgi:hypothetical protein